MSLDGIEVRRDVGSRKQVNQSVGAINDIHRDMTVTHTYVCDIATNSLRLIFVSSSHRRSRAILAAYRVSLIPR